MGRHCRLSCQKYAQIEEDLQHITSFFDLSADDIDGNNFEFKDLKDKVTVVINVASKCGYTESHYKGLNELYSTFKDTGKFEILAFPSNQFGEQEPESCPNIKKFAKRKGVEFRMMYKIDVNGADAHIVYRYLKAKVGPKLIDWNFHTYYVISKGGEIMSFPRAEPMGLADIVGDLLDADTSEL
jgi:glutathione peroxidase-family protein